MWGLKSKSVTLICSLVVTGTAHQLGINYYANFLGRLGSNGFQQKWRFGTHGNWKKIKIPEAVLELPARQHCQSSSPFTTKKGQIGWIGSAVYLVTAPKISIFSIAMGADYSFEVKVPAFFKHNNSSVATVTDSLA